MSIAVGAFTHPLHQVGEVQGRDTKTTYAVQVSSVTPGPELSDGIEVLSPTLAEQPNAAGLIGCLEDEAGAEQSNPLVEFGVVYTCCSGKDADPHNGTLAGKQIEHRPCSVTSATSSMTRSRSGLLA